MIRSRFLVLAAISLVAAGCSSETESKPTLSVGSFNAGLADGYVFYAREREPFIVADLPKSDLGIVCMEEVWTQDDWDDLTEGSKDVWPHTFRRDNEASEVTKCDDGELDDLETCANDKCADVTVDKLADCALAMCKPGFASLSKLCTQCLISQVGNDIGTIKATCEAGVGSAYAYDGSFGTGILSKYELADTDSLLFKSTANRRSVLYAKAKDTPVGDVDVFCMHLTANLTDVPYAGEADSWADEQAKQIDELVDYVNEKAGDSNKVVILGDFNTGPKIGSIAEELPDNYQKFLDAGYDDFYAKQDDVKCSFCSSNPLVSNQEGDGPLIDHIFLAGGALKGKGTQFMRSPITITVKDEDDKETEEVTAYSDHYGVCADLTAAED